jgi:cullin 1
MCCPPNDHAKELYKRYKELLVEHSQTRILPLLKKKAQNDHATGTTFLCEFIKCWENHGKMIRWLSSVFNYINRYYIHGHMLPSLKEVGDSVYIDEVYNVSKKEMRDAVLRLVRTAREEGEIWKCDDWVILKAMDIYHYTPIETYRNDFEVFMLQETANYYRDLSASWILESSTMMEYVLKSEHRLKLEEANRLWKSSPFEYTTEAMHKSAANEKSTRYKVIKTAETQLLTIRSVELLDRPGSGLDALMQNDKKADIQILYRVFKRVPDELGYMAQIFKKHIKDQGMLLIRDAEGGKQKDHLFIRSLLGLYDTSSKFLECFENAPLFQNSLKETFETICNNKVGSASVSELLAYFCDSVLRKGGIKTELLTGEDIDVVLDKAIKILAYVSDRDIFGEFYRKRLGRRLLQGLSINDDSERMVLGRLREQCGAHFTGKMDGMVKDMDTAKEKHAQFHTWMDAMSVRLPVDMSVVLLTTGFWSGKSMEMVLPEEMNKGLDAFMSFYRSGHKNTRKITWQFSLGTVHVKASFDKDYEFVLAPAQVAVLHQFNDNLKDKTYTELQDKTKLPEEDLDRVLASLTLLKYKVLVKFPANGIIGKDDVFSLNELFTDRAHRIRIGLPPVESERNKVKEDVQRDRSDAIKAAIVRVMKSRKVLHHQHLTIEVTKQLTKKFSPEMKAIKISIEKLIDGEYLQRDPEHPDLYRYVA